MPDLFLLFSEVRVHCDLEFIVRECVLHVGNHLIVQFPAIGGIKADYDIKTHLFLIL